MEKPNNLSAHLRAELAQRETLRASLILKIDECNALAQQAQTQAAQHRRELDAQAGAISALQGVIGYLAQGEEIAQPGPADEPTEPAVAEAQP